MPQFHKQSHIFKDVNGKLALVKVYPTMEIAQKDTKILAQGGELWEPNGELIPKDKWPKWVGKELKRCPDNELEKHGFVPSEIRELALEKKPKKPTSKRKVKKPTEEVDNELQRGMDS